MLQYLTINKYKHLNNLINLWNGEYRKTFPISKSSYRNLILNDSNLNEEASFVALYDNEPVGFIFIKTWLKDSGLINEKNIANISLIFVKKEMRNMGIGSDLLKLAISEIKKHSTINKIIVGNDINGLFPGVPNELNDAPIFFMNKGFIQKEGVVDMIHIVKDENEGNDSNTKDVNVGIATEEEKDELLKLCVKNNYNREAFLINNYFEKGGSGRRIVLLRKDDKIIGFARFEDENKSLFRTSIFMKKTSLGNIIFEKLDEDYKNIGYEEILNQSVRNYIIKRGCNKIVVLATKNIHFYKQLDYSVYKYYLQFELEI
ncbi:MAG: GNAT family N-acetyltransferase [Candidatus Caccosoma sp.]|nr:GNAT family N-acetyltransferase [Candidatus Caccosoma sp.]